MDEVWALYTRSFKASCLGHYWVMDGMYRRTGSKSGTRTLNDSDCASAEGYGISTHMINHAQDEIHAMNEHDTNIHFSHSALQSVCRSGMYPKHHDKIIKLGLEEVPYLPNLTLNGCHLILTYLPKEKKKKDNKTLDRKVHLWFPTLPITRRCSCPSKFPRNVESCVWCAVPLSYQKKPSDRGITWLCLRCWRAVLTL